MRTSTRVVVFLALIVSAIAFTKQQYCVSEGWAQPTTDIHMCYTDISALYGERFLDQKSWPYSHGDQSLEYPVLTGVVTYLLSLPIDTVHGFYYLNALFLVLLFIGCALLLHKIRPEYSYLYLLAPAGILAFFINWDFWAIISMLAAILWFDKQRYEFSALALAISISTKFMPVFLLLPIVILLWKRAQFKAVVRYCAFVAGTFLVINLPVALTTPKAWEHFYLFNITRRADWGSLWYALQIFKIDLTDLNYLMLIAMLLVLALIAIFIIGAQEELHLSDLAFIVMALVFTVSKVYSPQYVLWLIPLAVIALRDRRDIHAFWIWQAGEVIYYIAIWQHLALLAGAKYGVEVGLYGVAIFIRIITTIYLIERLIAGLRVKVHKGASDFLFEGASNYP